MCCAALRFSLTRQVALQVAFTKSYCEAAQNTCRLLAALDVDVEIVQLDRPDEGRLGRDRLGPVQQLLREYSNVVTVPQVFVNGTFVGGDEQLSALAADGKLRAHLVDLGARGISDASKVVAEELPGSPTPSAKERAAQAFRAKDYALAKQLYTEAISAAPRDHSCWSNRSACNLKLGAPHLAAADAFVCMDLKPDWAKSYLRLGQACSGMSGFSEAAENFKVGAKAAEMQGQPNEQAVLEVMAEVRAGAQPRT